MVPDGYLRNEIVIKLKGRVSNRIFAYWTGALGGRQSISFALAWLWIEHAQLPGWKRTDLEWCDDCQTGR